MSRWIPEYRQNNFDEDNITIWHDTYTGRTFYGYHPSYNHDKKISIKSLFKMSRSYVKKNKHRAMMNYVSKFYKDTLFDQCSFYISKNIKFDKRPALNRDIWKKLLRIGSRYININRKINELIG